MKALIPTRAHGLEILDAFTSRAGEAYRRGRNFAPPPEGGGASSLLSPYLQRRLVSEEEVIRDVLKANSMPSAMPFIQEVLWRTYWKGWINQHPGIWRVFLERAHMLRASPPVSFFEAISGKTGIDCFDAWVVELLDSGYLHNHIRMWFASIWIFTLKLPWELGAEFFYRHLLDADPASNTLSWRWVAGLHTRGKHYLARASNIAEFTSGRFPSTPGLAENAPAVAWDGLEDERVDPTRSPASLEPLRRPRGKILERLGLLIYPEDLLMEKSEITHFPIRAILVIDPSWASLIIPSALQVANWSRNALRDAAARAADHFGATVEWLTPGDADQAADLPLKVEAWRVAQRLDQVVTADPMVGPWQEVLRGLDPGHFFFNRRAYDVRLFPLAQKGFFNFRKHFPDYLGTFTKAANDQA